MCLITFAYQQHPQYPFILIANRDEFYARPTTAMSYWQDHPTILAGRDKQQMGTWLGLHTSGKLSAVTNYRDGNRAAQSNALSRGHLINDFLLSNNGTTDFLATLQPKFAQYGACNLLMADQHAVYITHNQSAHSSAARKLTPGVYGLCNAHLDTPWPKLVSAKAQLTQLLNNKTIVLEELKNVLNDTTETALEKLPDTGISKTWEKSLSSQFIHLDNYGTRAKSIILQHISGRTEVCEISYDKSGAFKQSDFTLQIPLIGGSPNHNTPSS